LGLKKGEKTEKGNRPLLRGKFTKGRRDFCFCLGGKGGEKKKKPRDNPPFPNTAAPRKRRGGDNHFAGGKGRGKKGGRKFSTFEP